MLHTFSIGRRVVRLVSAQRSDDPHQSQKAACIAIDARRERTTCYLLANGLSAARPTPAISRRPLQDVLRFAGLEVHAECDERTHSHRSRRMCGDVETRETRRGTVSAHSSRTDSEEKRESQGGVIMSGVACIVVAICVYGPDTRLYPTVFWTLRYAALGLAGIKVKGCASHMRTDASAQWTRPDVCTQLKPEPPRVLAT